MVQGQRGENVSLLLAISVLSGVEKFLFQSGSIKKEIFQTYLIELSTSLNSQDRILFVFDNARCHSNVTLLNENHIVK